MTYAMQYNNGKYAITNKKDFSTAWLMDIDDANKMYDKIKIVSTNETIIRTIKSAQIQANSNLKDYHSKI